jgi:hypothetical protein
MFEQFLKILDALGQINLSPGLDPGKLVGLAKDLPLPVGIALVVAGLIACLLGARPIIFRIVLTPVAAMAGFALAPKAAVLLHLSPKMISYAGGVLGGVCAAVWPPIILFLAFGAVGASVGSELAGEKDFWIGFIPGFLLGGLLAIVVTRILSVIVSSILGAVMFVVGLLTLISFTRLADLIFGAPVLSAGLMGCVAIAAMAFQFKFSPNEDEREKAQAEKRKQKELDADAKVREKRFKKYDKKAARK